ncbi:MAG: putative porin [Flavobacteriales bacterium]
MKYGLFVFILLSFLASARAQTLGPVDTLKSSQRTFGSSDTLLEVMQGFASTFYTGPQMLALSPHHLLLPGLSYFSQQEFVKKPLMFSALPHLGFAYGFGSQGSQRLRLDYEQAFAKNTLFNLRYERWQRSGFIRADELRFSGLTATLHQKGKRHTIQACFQNASNDRQWAGGLQEYAQLGVVSLDLIPVVKESARTQNNQYRTQLDLSYLLLGDSSQALSIRSVHLYEFKKRTYNEWGALLDFYPQTFLNADTCSDVFTQQFLENRLGLDWASQKLSVTALLGLKQREWADAIFNYDTTEVNVYNQLAWRFGKQRLNHRNQLNLLGAGQGWHEQTRYTHTGSRFDITIEQQFSNEWPDIFQRAYYSNLTAFSWQNLQKEQLQQLRGQVAYQFKDLKIGLKVSAVSFKNVYRFDFSSMKWATSGAYSAGNMFLLQPHFAYQIKAWQLRTSYQFMASEVLSFLPQHTADIGLTWKGGVFKDQRLKLQLKANVSYQSSFQALVFLPFIESLDWLACSANTVQNGFFNANVGAAIEVKTFRFFVNASNLGTFWSPAELSVFEGYPFAPLQIRLGLTWDFWN